MTEQGSEVPFAIKVAQERLPVAIEGRNSSLEGLLSQGKINCVLENLLRISRYSLLLGQYSYVVDHDIKQSKRYFEVPGASSPGFVECMKLLEEGIRGVRPWDGVGFSLDICLELILCMLLLGDVDGCAAEYEAVRAIGEPPMFQRNDAYFPRPIFTWHLILAARGWYDHISPEHYEKCTKKRRTEPWFARDYRSLMYPIALGDEADFNMQLEQRHVEFVKRRSSRMLESEWGYGEASQWCFDALGTGICRLAHRRGLEVRVPDQRYYPNEFWRD